MFFQSYYLNTSNDKFCMAGGVSDGCDRWTVRFRNNFVPPIDETVLNSPRMCQKAFFVCRNVVSVLENGGLQDSWSKLMRRTQG